jgi:hypothetical protein
MKKVLLLGVVVIAALSAMVPTTSVADPPCAAKVDRSSGAAGDLLLSVTGPPERAVAVGIHFVGGDGTPLVERRSGDSWTKIRVPTEPGARMIQLQDATKFGVRVWVVGAFRNDRPQAGWIGGGSWHQTRPVDPGTGEDELLGVAATPDGTVWAVGKHQVGPGYQPLIERFDGAGWSVVATPAVSGSAVLKDVAAAPDGSIYAAGWTVLPGGVTRPLVERWDGARWSRESADGDGLLSGVGILPDGSPLAVGWRQTADGDRILTMQRRGFGWTPLAPATGQPGRLSSVAVGESTVAVGTRFDDGVPAPIVLRLRGRWSPVDVTGGSAPGTGGDQLLGITGEPGSFLAVGIRDETDTFASLAVGGECVG